MMGDFGGGIQVPWQLGNIPVQFEDKGFLELLVLLIGATIWQKSNKGLQSNIRARVVGVILGPIGDYTPRGVCIKPPKALKGTIESIHPF
jgi:hypothetical protein